MPDYSNVTTISENTILNYAAIENCYLSIIGQGSTQANISVNDTYIAAISGSSIGNNTLFLPLNKGDIITSDITIRVCKVIPIK